MFTGVAYQAVAERLIRLAEKECSAFKMPAVMILFWALVRLEVPVSEAFLDGMAARATARLRELPLPEPQYVSGILWAFSRIRAGQPLSPAQVSTPSLSRQLTKVSVLLHNIHPRRLLLQWQRSPETSRGVCVSCLILKLQSRFLHSASVNWKGMSVIRPH